MTWQQWKAQQFEYLSEYGIHKPLDYCHLGEMFCYKLKGNRSLKDYQDLELGLL